MRSPHPALRPLQNPRPVLVAPSRAWIAPEPGVLRVPGTAASLVRSFDPQIDAQRVLGYLDTWARMWWSPNQPVWFARVCLIFHTAEPGCRRRFLLWLPADAITPLDPLTATVPPDQGMDAHPALRHALLPRPVLVDPWNAWPRPGPMSMRQPVKLRVGVESFDLRCGQDWLPGHLTAWARLRWSAGLAWYGQVGVDLRTRDQIFARTFRLWLPENAIRAAEPAAGMSQRGSVARR